MRLSPRREGPSTALVFFIFLGFVVVTAAVSQARSAESPLRNVASRPAVSIVLAGGEATTRAALAEAFRHSLGRSGIEVVISSVVRITPGDVADSGATSAGRVIMWLDLELGPSKVATLYVTEGNRVFTRPLALPQGFDAIALELLDVVVTNAAEAVLAGKELGGIPREEFKRLLESQRPPPAATVVAEAEPSTRSQLPKESVAPNSEAVAALRPPLAARGDATASSADRGSVLERGSHREGAALIWSVAAVYSGALLASTQTFHGPGAVLDVQNVAWRLGAEIATRFPYETSDGATTVRLSGQTFRVSVARLFALGAHLAATTALGVGADLTHVRTVVSGENATAAPAFWALDPAVRSAIGLESRHGKLRLGLAAGVDVDLVAPRYVVAGASPSAGANQPLWIPWRWRPYAALTVGLTL